MFGFLCRVFGHRFKYIRRYYRCARCGVRKCDLSKKRQERMMMIEHPIEGNLDTAITTTTSTTLEE